MVNSAHMANNPLGINVDDRSVQLLNALRALPVYRVFEDEKLKGSNEKSFKRKIAYKRLDDYYNC